ncbi:MOSC domain-containing protein [Amycolatopsis cihanbeyliensis]|uniref:MOSC domain-containing protein n=1 Tax=Amycolatopsis cihanbeyliensis TaxID=1128664 RepID=UPI0011514915|nr:MOSC domain-containing protein [Amycolatopsis cihanbeyliensis]
MTVSGVYTGEPSVLGTRRDGDVYSAISKARVIEPEIGLGPANLDGDRQADQRVHGGPDKAVYAYPVEHYRAWAANGFALEAGSVGENLSIAGADEQRVRIGDVWEWGTALLRVSQPRTPCYKLGMKAGRKDVLTAMIDSGRCGWYLGVVRPGLVPTSGPIRLVERDLSSPTVAEVFLLTFASPATLDEPRGQACRELAERVLAAPWLAERYRATLRRKLGGE